MYVDGYTWLGGKIKQFFVVNQVRWDQDTDSIVNIQIFFQVIKTHPYISQHMA